MSKVSGKIKFLLFVVFSIAYLVFYIYPNLFPHSPPTYLPMLSWESSIPLVPWSFVIYFSDYIVVPYVIIALTREGEFYAYARMTFLVLITSGLIFLFYPTTYPRPPYPNVENPMISFLMHLLWSGDTPNNCFPSMHVAISGVAAWSMRGKSRILFVSLVLWALAVFVSTLTTKQHYIIDIFGGVAVAITAILIEEMVVKRVLATRCSQSQKV